MAVRGGAWPVKGSNCRFAWVCQGEDCQEYSAQGQYKVHKTYFKTGSEMNSTGTGYVSNKYKIYCPTCSVWLAHSNVPEDAEEHWQWMSGKDLDDIVEVQAKGGGKGTNAASSGAGADAAVRQSLETLTGRVEQLEQLVQGLSGRLDEINANRWH
jgi:hypothetical protein